MMLANAPVVWAGKELGGRISMKKVRWLTAASFLVMGTWSLTISQYFLAIPQ
jgi:putative Ca2+/H+ antiporter (TMEM165/GDT1 family)